MPDPSSTSARESFVRDSRQVGLLRFLLTFSLTLLGLGFVAIPRFGSPLSPESARQAALAELRSIVEAQNRWQAEARVDVDGDGVGEFAALFELAGKASPRLKGEGSFAASLPLSFSDEGPNKRLRVGSYLFELWLPAKGGGWISARKLGELHDDIDVDAAEQRWCAFAWPTHRVFPAEGPDCFFVDARGEIYGCVDEATHWGGLRRVPHPGLLPSTPYSSGDTPRRLPARFRDGAGRSWVWHY